MSDLSVFITNLEAQSKQLAINIESSFANHNQLLGYTNAVNEILSIVGPLISAMLPSVAPEADAIETAVNQVVTADDAIVVAPLTTEA